MAETPAAEQRSQRDQEGLSGTDHGIFGLKSPGRFFAILIPVLLFAALFLGAWWAGALDCHNFKSCPQLQR